MEYEDNVTGLDDINLIVNENRQGDTEKGEQQ